MSAHTSIEMTPLLSNPAPATASTPAATIQSLEDAIEEIRTKKLPLEKFKKVFKDHPNPREEIKAKNLLFTIVSGSKLKTFDMLFVLLPKVDSEILSAVDKNGKTVLHVAVEHDHDRCTQAIIRKDKASLTRGDNDGNTPLHYMVRFERISACKKAIDVILEKYKFPASQNSESNALVPKNDGLESSEAQKKAIKFCSDVINRANKNSISALHLAARERSPEIMKIFLDNGGDPKALTNKGLTPLHFAAQSGSLQCVKYLLEKIPHLQDQIEYLNMQTDIGCTALMLAAKGGFVAVCQELRQTDCSLKSRDGNTALTHAASKGLFHLVKILANGCEAQSETLPEEKAKLISLKNIDFIFSCLKAAIHGKSDTCFTYFLNKAEEQFSDAKIKELVDLSAATSLKCIKQMAGRPEFDKYLNAYRTASGDSLLHLAVTMKSYVTAKELLNTTKIDKFVRNKKEDSALHLMARQPETLQNCHEEERQYVARKLLQDSRELVRSGNRAGETPLHLAARAGNADLIRAILHKEPNVLSLNKKKMTAIHLAAEMGHVLCLEMLLHSLKSQDYHTLRDMKPHPLHLCAGNGHKECCELLLKPSLVGENPEENLTLKAPNGQYPVDRAFRAKQEEVFCFLLGKMKFKEDEEFAVRLHRYMKKCLTVVNEQRDPSCGSFYTSAIEAMIESSWCKAVLDGRYCSPTPQHPSNVKEQQPNNSLPQPPPDSNKDGSDQNAPKPCESFALLIRTHSRLACEAMDKHISVLSSPACEVHDYTPFEYIYYCTEGEKKLSPFEAAPQTKMPSTSNPSQQSSSAAAPSSASQATATGALTGGGTVGTNPGAAGTNPGAAGTNPGAAGTNPSVAGANPGTTGTNPGVASANPGTAGTNPGAASTKPRSRRARKRIAPVPNVANSVGPNTSQSTGSNTTKPASFPASNSTCATTTNPTTRSAGSNPVAPTQHVTDIKKLYERRLKENAVEFETKSWCKDHPLQEAVRGGHTQVLRHKLVQSWLLKKFRYARWVLYPYVFMDVLTAAFVYWLQALLWNTRQLEVYFNGVTREQLTSVYDDIAYNGSVAVLVWDIFPVAAYDLRCATWAADSEVQEPLYPGSAAWNRSLCAIYHLQQKTPLVVSMEVVVSFLILVHLFIEFKFLHSTSLAVWDVHRVSRLCLRLPFMVILLFGASLCDFQLGCRNNIIWLLGVVAVLLSWIHVVLTLNKVPRFSGFMPVTPVLLLRYVLAVVPLLLFLWAFALAFHLLFFDALPFETVPYSLIKTVTWLLGDLGYDDTFRNDDSPLAYPVLSNILFVVFIICIGGLVLNFIIGHPTEKLFELRKEDDLNRAVAHLHIHLIIDECVPSWRRRYAMSHGVITNTTRASLYVSSEMLQSYLQGKEIQTRDVEKLEEAVTDIQNKLNSILETLEVLNGPKVHRHDQSADTCSTFHPRPYLRYQNTIDA